MSTNAAADRQAKLFAAYLASRIVVIADPSSASRAGIAKTIVGLGAKIQNVKMCPNYSSALDEINATNPHIVICDYDLGAGQCGLNLLQEQRKNRPDAKDSLFVLVTGNTSQSTVAQAAEEDVDTFILKPYTLEIFRNTIMKAALSKVNPSEYQKTIDEGKKLLFEGKADEAIAIFEKAATLDPKPALALFYKGQAHLIKKTIERAQTSYQTGLDFNKIHYKCLVGLYDLLMEQKKFSEAYDIVKRVARYFPANPERLASVLRLAVINKSYEDIERYYQIFTSIESRTDELVKYICAALIICGKFYLQSDSTSRGVELFQKAAVTSAGRTKVLREIIQSLVDYKLYKEAATFLQRFPQDTRSQADYLTMEYLVSDKSNIASKSIETGRSLISSGIHDPVIYRVLINRTYEMDLKDAAESLIQEALKRYPEQAESFKALANPSLIKESSQKETSTKAA